MIATTHEPLNINSQGLAVLAELLKSEQARLLIEIRHTRHCSFRDELRHRLGLVEELVGCCRPGEQALSAQRENVTVGVYLEYRLQTGAGIPPDDWKEEAGDDQC